MGTRIDAFTWIKYGLWRQFEILGFKAVQDILQDQVHTELASTPVSMQVNSVKINGPDNIRPVE